MSWISRLFFSLMFLEYSWWFVNECDFVLMCCVFQGELQQSSNCKPLWVLTCLSRAYCTWCYLFKAICTELPPPTRSSHQLTPLKLQSFINLINLPAVTAAHQKQAIYGVSSLPYWGVLPCHMWSFLRTIYRVSLKWSRPIRAIFMAATTDSSADQFINRFFLWIFYSHIRPRQSS